MFQINRVLILLSGLVFSSYSLFSQCFFIPITLEQRIVKADVIVFAKPVKPTSFWDSHSNNIYTSHFLQINTVLKGDIPSKEISIITEGGIVGNIKQEVSSSLDLDTNKSYIFLLTKSKITLLNTEAYEAYGAAQGALVAVSSDFVDPSFGIKISRNFLFQKVETLVGQKAKSIVQDNNLFSKTSKIEYQKTNAFITNLSPNPVISGSADDGQILVIRGVGFGNTIGTVEFSNADDGGATLIQSEIPETDIVYWTNNEIRIKVPRQAGTGKVVVNGNAEASIEIKFSVLEVNSDFYSFASSTRQTLKILNNNNKGGYTFQYNATFLQNAAAVSAFERAIENWRCHTGMNYVISGALANVPEAETRDHINVVTFGALPTGVLGRATSWYTATANGSCKQSSTVWYTDEIDVVFAPTLINDAQWNYGPEPSVLFAKTYDLESVALHEMGHAHGLGHIIAGERVMNFAISNGTDKRILTNADIEAGLYKINQSKGLLCLTPAGIFGPLVPVEVNECVIPSTILSISGKHDEYWGNIINWDVSFENNIKKYIIWRSTDGINFDSIGDVLSKVSGVQDFTYTFIDTSAESNTVYKYRLAEKKGDNEERFSEIITINIPQGSYFDFYPTYVKHHDVMTIVPHNIPIGDISVTIYDGMGKKVLEQKIFLSTPGKILNFTLPPLQEGIYIYHIQKDDVDMKGKMLIKNQ